MQIKYIFLVLCIGMLPGCKQYFFWGRDSFIQAPKIRVDIAQARDFLQTKRLYDEASTVGIFDVLWLNHTVRMAYVNIYATRKGFSEEEKEVLVAEHKKEVQDTLSFYVLMDNDQQHILSLKVQESRWSIYLRINNKTYNPVSIKPVVLTPEYSKIFGYRHNQFRSPYLVVFHAQDSDDEYLLKHTNRLELHINSVNHKVSFYWDI